MCHPEQMFFACEGPFSLASGPSQAKNACSDDTYYSVITNQ